MLGRSHLLVGTAGWLLLAEPLAQVSGSSLTLAELASGTAVCAGAAMLPDIDHPQATVSRSLGPLSEGLARAVSALAGGHRNGTHSLPFAAGVGFLTALGLGALSGPWLAFGLTFFFCALALGTLIEADPPVIGVLAASVAATAVAVAPGDLWLAQAVALGCLLHILADAVTSEGVPLLFPLSRQRFSVPLVGNTGGVRERIVAWGCGLLSCWLYLTIVVLPIVSQSSS